MTSFRELEELHAGTVLNGAWDDIETHGVLRLQGQASELRLSSSDLLPYPKDESGWFDLDLRTPDGKHVHFHNALYQNWGDQARDGRRSQSTIHPNVVVFDAEALGKDRLVKAIWFRAEALGEFFVHRSIERHFVGTSPAHLEVLRDMRRETKKGPYGKWSYAYDFHRPAEMIVVHSPSKILSFHVEGRHYSLSWGQTHRGLSGANVDIRSYPVARIGFAAPVSIDLAMDACIKWLRYFSQIAFNRLYFEEMTATAASGRKAKYAAIYPSYFPRRESDSKSDRFSSHDVPLARWRDRKKMAEAMRRWLEQGASRTALRQAMDRMLDARIQFDPFADVVMICGAIENLGLARSTHKIPKATIAAMSAEAARIAQGLGLELEPARIRSALSVFNSPGLIPHLEALLAISAPDIRESSKRLIMDSTRFVRNLAAHGAVQSDMLQPLAIHVRQFWLAASILFDLKSAGYPTREEDRSTVADQLLRWSRSQIEDIQRRSETTNR